MNRIRVRALMLATACALASTAASSCASHGAAPAQAPTPQAQVQTPAQLGAPTYVPEFGTMWTFEAPPLDYWKTRYNFAPGQGWLDHVRLASVRLPGCSSSFVSENGLVMTNHHCARSCISAVSPSDTNYQRTGYVAATLGEEKKCPGMYVDQLESIQDVTARIRAKMSGTEAQQVAARDAEIQAIQSECGATGLNCQVVPFYQGGKYSLYRYRRYNDLRLVLAPEEAISFFGGDPDNFTYPRFDLDLTLLRVYGADGQPFHPKDYLHWSAAGAKEGDLVFVVGNPGSTGRLLTMGQMEYLRDVQYPAQLAGYKRQLAVLNVLSAQSEANRRRFENAIFGIANSQKAVTGYWAGLKDSTIMAKKRAFERDFRARIAADPKLQAEYGGAWDAIATAERELTTIAARQRYYGLGGSTLLQTTNHPGNISDENRPLTFGLFLSDYWSGALDDVRIYNRVISSPTEISALYHERGYAQ